MVASAVLLRHFCRPKMTNYQEILPVLLRARQLSFDPHTCATKPVDDTVQATNGEHVTKYFFNRNPRSAELLGTADKPRGYATHNMRVDYYHRLMVNVSERHFSAYVNHNNGMKVVEASTNEFCISKHLYKTSDVAAAFNIGRVIAIRCKEVGLRRVMWQHKRDRKHKKVIAFLKGIKLEGLILNEPKQRTLLQHDSLTS